MRVRLLALAAVVTSIARGATAQQPSTFIMLMGSDTLAVERVTRAANHAVQIHGGYGIMEEFPVARYWRDVKIGEIGEGTSEIQRTVIARLLGA